MEFTTAVSRRVSPFLSRWQHRWSLAYQRELEGDKPSGASFYSAERRRWAKPGRPELKLSGQSCNDSQLDISEFIEMYTIECFERRSGPLPAFYCIPSKVKFMAFTCSTPTSRGSLNAVSQLLKLKTRSSFQACLCLICVSLNIKGTHASCWSE